MLIDFVSVLLATMTVAQSGPAPAAPAAGKETKAPIVLSGCVSRDSATPTSVTFSDTGGAKYRLSGVSVKKYVGQRVELVGGPGRRLSIRGGLVPSANVAAQAGYMDPAQAAVAGMPGGANSGTGDVVLPEFRVTRVRALDGSCQ